MFAALWGRFSRAWSRKKLGFISDEDLVLFTIIPTVKSKGESIRRPRTNKSSKLKAEGENVADDYNDLSENNDPNLLNLTQRPQRTERS